MQTHSWVTLAIATSLVLHTGLARAAEGDEEEEKEEAPEPFAGRLRLPHAERPLTLPRLVLAPASQIYVDREDTTFVNLRLGAAFGITDDLEVETVVAPLKLSPPVTYAELDQPGPSLGATYRLIARRTQLGLHVDATAITLAGASGVILRPGLPIHSRAGDHVRIDYGLFVRATFGRTKTYGYDLPFVLSVDLAPPLHIGFRTGVSAATTDQPLGITIPFGVFFGYSVPGTDGPLLDIEPFVLWPKAIGGNNAPQASPSKTSPFEVGIALRGYFYL